MKNLTDEQLIKIIKRKNNKSNDAFEILVDRNRGICFNIIKRYKDKITSVGKQSRDLTDDHLNIIYKSCLKYKSNKGTKFSTWLGYQTRYACQLFYIRNKPLDSLDELISSGSHCEPFCKRSDLQNYITEEKIENLMKKNISTEGAEILRRRHMYSSKKESKWRAISKDLKIKIPELIKIYNKSMKIMAKKI